VLVDVAVCQNFVCSTPASENASDWHVMGFPCDDTSVPILLQIQSTKYLQNTEICCLRTNYYQWDIRFSWKSMKATAFWDIAQCSLVEGNWRFRVNTLMMQAVHTSEMSTCFNKIT
jgi:hypothetical protein